jgi:hypothetical protein
MIEHELMSRAEMVRSPMAVSPIATLPLSQDSDDPVKHLLQAYAELLELPVPKSLQMLIEASDLADPQASGDL